MWKLLLSIFVLFYSFTSYSAVVIGTNSGFVTARPTVDPAGSISSSAGRWNASKDVSSSGVDTVDEIGFWQDGGISELNWECGIYAHEAGDDTPGTLLEVDRTNATGASGSRFIPATSLGFSISASTTYWVAVQTDDAVTDALHNFSTTASRAFRSNVAKTELPSPSDDDGTFFSSTSYSIYAIESTAATAFIPRIIISKYNPRFGYNVLGS